MADDDELDSFETGDDTMLREAVEALRKGDRIRARDLLTRLLKTDQTNATYWVWLSAVVETRKERIYCLETALKQDPDNTAAKRGLILMGARPPDDSVPPFPLNRPRPWEESLVIPKEPVEKSRGWANPVVRIFAIMGIAVITIGLFVGGYTLFNPQGVQSIFATATHRPTFTLSLTPSLTPVYRTATPTFLGPTPLSYFLLATYTKTPVYMITKHPILTNSTFETGLRFLEVGQYETARVQFELVLDNEPDAADVYYFIGESYRLEEDYKNALDAYQDAIKANPDFAPSFVGRALANLGRYPDADVLADLDIAIAIDSHYAEAYITRGWYQIKHGSYRAAIRDLKTAIELTPGSALAWLYLAQAQLGDGQYDAGLESALKANELDLTLVPVYLTLAQAYISTGQTALAVAVLQTYTIYEPDDVGAYLALGTAYNAAGDYQTAVVVLSRYLDANSRNAEAYFQRGLAYLNLDSPNLAEDDFKMAVGYDPNDFDSHLGLARAYFDQGKPGDAYLQAYENAEPLAKTDITKAQVFFWEAIFLEAIDDPTSAMGARNNWYKLIALPEGAMSAEWRATAFEHLGITPTFTPSPHPSRTPTKSITPGP
jgi:tetratricopeptide (TPR) repeat protein